MIIPGINIAALFLFCLLLFFIFHIIISHACRLSFLDHFTNTNINCHDYMFDKQIGKSVHNPLNSDPYMEMSITIFATFVLKYITPKEYKFQVKKYSEIELNRLLTKSIVYSINERLFSVYQMLEKTNTSTKSTETKEYVHNLKKIFLDREVFDETYYFTSLHYCTNPQHKRISNNIKSKIEYNSIDQFLKEFISNPQEISDYIDQLNNSNNYQLYHEILDYVQLNSPYVYYSSHSNRNLGAEENEEEEEEEEEKSKKKHKKYGEQLFEKVKKNWNKKDINSLSILRLVLYRPERTFAFVVDFEYKVDFESDHIINVEILTSKIMGIQHQQNLSYSYYQFNNRSSSSSSSSSRRSINTDENDNKKRNISFHQYQKERNEKVLELFKKFKRQIYGDKLSIYLLSYTKNEFHTEEELLNPKPILAAPKTTTREILYNKNRETKDDDPNQSELLLEYDYLDAGYFCYGKNGKLSTFDQRQKYQCESKFDKFGRNKNENTYDRPCRTNEECPFYRKNTNYENNRGGCHNGTCEFPVGLDRISPRKFETRSKPYCHNCKDISTHDCCLDQLTKTDTKYSFMQSPDYAFTHDFIDRNNQSDILLARGLLP